ncbi:hypothetical protein GPALN_006476 [Globodera pallida]|uniref:S-adenosyl-L-methionine-dependent methyltransferase n=1 Tax=Globodera pallida TaxID=36090 RepID=A0A183BLA2_GLOPA|nr:hypothetical protein GPALN_006476 [Globodera pallida]
MVFIDSLQQQLLCNAEETVNCEYSLDSGSMLAYVVPQRYSTALATVTNGDQTLIPTHPRRKLSTANGGGGIDEIDRWEGVLDFCDVLDCAVEVDNETELFENKRVLEVGFCTGLPSAFAYRRGAKSLCVYSWDMAKLDTVVKPTLHRNNVPRSLCKFFAGDFDAFKQTMGGQKFEVILAPELINMDEGEFERMHEMLDDVLSPQGIILFSSRSHYTACDCTGNLPAWLDLLKTKGTFDAHIRWTSPKADIAPRKMVQMTRSIR